MEKSLWGVVAAVLGTGGALVGGCSHAVYGPVAGELEPLVGDGGVGAAPSGPRPTFPTTVVASKAPPPISGGTLLVTSDGQTAIAADPDRDAIYGVDLASSTVRYTVHLQEGDEPGRVAEDGSGRVHVALRGGGALVTLDESTGAVLQRRSVCPAPRGVAWDKSSDSMVVACATGELVTLPSAGGAATATLQVERDLRDVVIQNGAMSVSSFRAAQILRLNPDGTVARRDALPAPLPEFNPHVVWRAVASPSGSIVTVHQAASTQSISTKIPGGYGGGSSGPFPTTTFAPPFEDAALGPLTFGTSDDAGLLFEGDSSAPVPVPLPSFQFQMSAVLSVFTEIQADGTIVSTRPFSGVLPVDVAVSPDGSTVAVAAPGSSFTPEASNVMVFRSGGENDTATPADTQPIAVGFDATGRVLVQTRSPATLIAYTASGGIAQTTLLAGSTRDDTGHDVFHTQAGASIACASCHPEGGDDGNVWLLDDAQRRTPSLRGTLVGTAPYHWPGDEADLPTLVNDVYTLRMAGAPLASDQMKALTGWVQSVPPPPAPSWVDPQAVSAGKTLFESSQTSCTTCHTGSKFTNNATVDVGTGGAFQVPPLVGVGWRTPLMHDGCAATLADRFSSTCATSAHGNTSQLSATDVKNLVAYLETL
jgi:hypothetical protein